MISKAFPRRADLGGRARATAEPTAVRDGALPTVPSNGMLPQRVCARRRNAVAGNDKCLLFISFWQTIGPVYLTTTP